jgi:hypothetical protein
MKTCIWLVFSLLMFIEQIFNQTPTCSNSDKYSKGFAKIYDDPTL